MADEQVIDDGELFKSAMEDAPVETQESPEKEVPEKETEQAKAERERDELGRFKAAEEKKEPEAPVVETKAEVVPPKAEDEANVPSWRLREVREAREAAERRADEVARESFALKSQLQEMQRQLQALQAPKTEPVDFFADPDAALQQRMTPIEQSFAQLERKTNLAISRSLAISEHGIATVRDLDKALEQAVNSNHPDMPNLSMQMRSSDDPTGVAMQWYKRNKLWEATGGDPEAYKAKVLEDALKNPEFMAKALETARAQAGQSGNPSIKLPPSLNKAAGSGLDNSAPDDGDTSDKGIFQYAMASGRR